MPMGDLKKIPLLKLIGLLLLSDCHIPATNQLCSTLLVYTNHFAIFTSLNGVLLVLYVEIHKVEQTCKVE